MADRPRVWVGDLLRAMIELGHARLRLDRHRPRIASATLPSLDERQARLVERVAYVIPRVAARMPWRADCLVQALAAERWLTRDGIATHLTLGVPREKPATFEAHAWLTAGDRIVTGGDVSGYVPFERG